MNKPLTELGRALFGARFSNELGAALGVSGRYVRQIADGERPLTADMRRRLKVIAKARAAAIRDAARHI